MTDFRCGTSFAKANHQKHPHLDRRAVRDYTTISDASLTLQGVLENGLNGLEGSPKVKVDNLMTKPTAPVVTLFLYEVLEDPSARNRPRSRVPVGPRFQIRKPNLSLLLRYLVTPWIDNLNAPFSDQLIIGRLSQVLYEKAIITKPDLKGASLEHPNEALKVTLAPISLEDRTRIWNSLQLPYRLSLTFEMRVVNIEPEHFTEVSPVAQGRFGYGDVVAEDEQ